MSCRIRDTHNVLGDTISKRLGETSAYAKDRDSPCSFVPNSLFSRHANTFGIKRYLRNPYKSLEPTNSLATSASVLTSPRACDRRSYYNCHHRERLHHTTPTTSCTTTITMTSTCTLFTTKAIELNATLASAFAAAHATAPGFSTSTTTAIESTLASTPICSRSVTKISPQCLPPLGNHLL